MLVVAIISSSTDGKLFKKKKKWLPSIFSKNIFEKPSGLFGKSSGLFGTSSGHGFSYEEHPKIVEIIKHVPVIQKVEVIKPVEIIKTINVPGNSFRRILNVQI